MTRHDAPWPQSRPVASLDRYANTIASRGFEGYAGSRSLPWPIRVVLAGIVILLAFGLWAVGALFRHPGIGIGASDGR
jgi:hypothetical protein